MLIRDLSSTSLVRIEFAVHVYFPASFAGRVPIHWRKFFVMAPSVIFFSEGRWTDGLKKHYIEKSTSRKLVADRFVPSQVLLSAFLCELFVQHFQSAGRDL